MSLSRGVPLALAVALLLSVSGCVSGGFDTARPEVSTPAASPSASPSPCHGGFIADREATINLAVETNVEGEPTPELAAEAWARSVSAPGGAPAEGWEVRDDRHVVSGDWIVEVLPTNSGDGWVVSGQGCL
jgi:hypothetical protein